MNIVDYKISDLIPAEYNPRQLSNEQHEQIKASLKRFGFVDPVIVNTHEDRKNIIIGGHMRTRVAESLGFEEVPCVELCLNLDQEKELNIRLNKNTGEFDFDALSNYFEVDSLVDWGFSLDELDLLEFLGPPLVGCCIVSSSNASCRHWRVAVLSVRLPANRFRKPTKNH